MPIDFHPEEQDVTPNHLAQSFGISETLAWAVVQENEYMTTSNTQEARRRRWAEVRAWAVHHLLPAHDLPLPLPSGEVERHGVREVLA